MKRVYACVFIVICLIVRTGESAGGLFDEQDAEAEDVAFFVSRLVGDDWVKEVREQYPGAEISWNGRALPVGKRGAQWLIYAEIVPPDSEQVYFIYEVRVRPIDDQTELERIADESDLKKAQVPDP